MIVAGFGMRAGAQIDSLSDALTRAGGQAAGALATLDGKLPALEALGRGLGLPVMGVSVQAAREQAVLTRSTRSMQSYGTGSVAEACALAAAGPGAQLMGARVVSGDGRATCALARRMMQVPLQVGKVGT